MHLAQCLEVFFIIIIVTIIIRCSSYLSLYNKSPQILMA